MILNKFIYLNAIINYYKKNIGILLNVRSNKLAIFSLHYCKKIKCVNFIELHYCNNTNYKN